MNREVITANIIIDTVYGFIYKVGTCRMYTFNNKECLEYSLDRTFRDLKIAILQEFDSIENQNKIEVEDD